jgi:hypothetical protein
VISIFSNCGKCYWSVQVIILAVLYTDLTAGDTEYISLLYGKVIL